MGCNVALLAEPNFVAETSALIFSATKIQSDYRNNDDIVHQCDSMTFVLGAAAAAFAVRGCWRLARFLPEGGSRVAEQAYGPAGTPGPLAGIPISIKDLTPTKGIRTTRGSLLYEDSVPEEDAPFVERIHAAGAAGDLLEAVADNAADIQMRYPPRAVVRRNTGYPLDDVSFRAPFGDDGPFSLARFLCGTEGTLAVTTEIKLALVPKPTKRLVVCAHFHDLMEALHATVIAVGHAPAAVELIDRRILEQTKHNIEQSKNRFFIEGEPDAILVIEFYRENDDELQAAADGVIAALRVADFGYAWPVVRPPQDAAVWELRKSGLGLLMGIPGDTKAVSVVEDTAVPVEVLPHYIADVMKVMAKYGTDSVYHAHASVGELHIRPELNLKDLGDVSKFAGIARDIALLVRDYRGSLSGEHGDGRVRAPLLPEFFGEAIYELHRRVKAAFDPNGILNPGKVLPDATQAADRPGQNLL
mgnify:CR=1 FL=1